MKTYSLEELTDKYIGERGSEERNQFEFELKTDILGEMIKKADNCNLSYPFKVGQIKTI